MTNVVMFPSQRVKTISMSPTILYSIAEYGDLPTLEYDHFTSWNNIYLNDRSKGTALKVSATVLGKSRSFFATAISLIEKRALDPEQFDPSRAAYGDLFEALSGKNLFKQYSIANNSLGTFSRDSSKVHLDILCTLQTHERAYLRVGFRTAITRMPLNADREALETVLMEQEA